jgi:cilia- and flagella-associated protein 57
LDNIKYEFLQVKRQLEEEKEMLDAKYKSLKSDGKEDRKIVEADAWKNIDSLNDKNKNQLNIDIERGMVAQSDLTDALKQLREENQKKETQVRNLEERRNGCEEGKNEIQGLREAIEEKKTEINDRDKTLDEKKHRILDLKKKIQELEKFKFVLDYKIKELKRDIGPREVQIQNLNEQTNKMRSELKHFSRVNQNLALIVDDLRMRQEGLSSEVIAMKK